MQTSAQGTYSGMLDCAGGILRNEGPLAFYKVRTHFSRFIVFDKAITRELWLH